MKTPFSRRQFLHRIGVVGGSVAVYQAALGLGLVRAAPRVEPPEIQRVRDGARQRVAILGAGIAGLAAAYELSRKGYDVMVFEASLSPRGPQPDAARWGRRR